MTRQKEAAELGKQGGKVTSGNVHAADCTSTQSASTYANESSAPAYRPTKKATILQYLTHSGSLNRFEAQRLGDSTLNSTISTLVNDHGIVFDKRRELVPNRVGGLTSVIRYKVSAESIDKAVALLAFWRVKA